MIAGVSSHHTALSLVYDAPGLVISGTLYRIRVAAKNKYGLGPYSDVFSILAAEVPEAPAPVITVQNALNSRISWAAPHANGASILSYDIEIKDANAGMSFKESSNCSGDNPSLTYCLVTYQELRSNDYGLQIGQLIEVRVRAINEIGPGSFSTVNTVGDIIRTEPLSPLSALAEGSSTDDS